MLRRRSQRKFREPLPLRPPTLRDGFDEVVGTYPPPAAIAEAGRCLDCDLLCSTCESVCPNRAFFTYRSAAREHDLPLLRWERGKPVVVDLERFELRPLISKPVYGYQAVNVEAQERTEHSLLNWMRRLIRVRR